MSLPPVVFEERQTSSDHRLGVATLHRQRQLNALNLDMCQLMLDHFRRWASDEGVVGVLLDGAGDKGFCAGADVAEVVRHVRAGGDRRFVYGDRFFDLEYQLDRLIHQFPKPFITYSHGVCMGGGLGLTVGASHRVVSDSSRIAMPEIHIGLFPDAAAGWFLNRMPGGAGLLMALTGLTINEADAIFAGLADYFVPLEAKADLYAQILALDWRAQPAHDRESLTRLMLSSHRRFKAGLPSSRLTMYFDAIRFIASQPAIVGVRDALLAAADQDPWFKAPATGLQNGSPTAAFVTWEYLRRTRQMSLVEVLALDLVLARQCQRRHDFPEGVRALLIDKDRAPQWSAQRFDQVSPALVAEHFSD